MKRNLFITGGLVILAGWLVRIIITGGDLFGFLIWNVFLATVPLMVETAFRSIRQYTTGVILWAGKVLLALVWILFLPNAFYLLTDLMHLNPNVIVDQRGDNFNYSAYYSRGDGLYIYDSLLLFCATAFGAYAGGLALYHAYAFLARRVKEWRASLILGVLMLLSAVGVYLGRYGRWNSWQAVTHPWRILTDLGDTLSAPVYRGRFFIVVFTMFSFAAISLAYVAYDQHYRKKHR